MTSFSPFALARDESPNQGGFPALGEPEALEVLLVDIRRSPHCLSYKVSLLAGVLDSEENWTRVSDSSARNFGIPGRSLRLFNGRGHELLAEQLYLLKSGDLLFCSDTDRLESTQLLSLYQKGDKLGEGGFGEVHAARHLVSGEQVAIKELKLCDPESAFKELGALTSLAHPHIIPLQQALLAPSGSLVLIMELGGRSLRDYVYRRGRLEQCETRHLLRQLLGAVDYCHKRGVVHRDIKLQNVVFSRHQPGQIKIIDFGIADLTQQERTRAMTLRYAAPELLDGSCCQAGPKLDIWALGVVVFRCLFGRFPFDAISDAKLKRAIINTSLVDFPHHPSVSDEAKDLLLSMLHQSPKQRASVWDVIEHPWMQMATRPCNEVEFDSRASTVLSPPFSPQPPKPRASAEQNIIRGRSYSRFQSGGGSQTARKYKPGLPLSGIVCSASVSKLGELPLKAPRKEMLPALARGRRTVAAGSKPRSLLVRARRSVCELPLLRK